MKIKYSFLLISLFCGQITTAQTRLNTEKLDSLVSGIETHNKAWGQLCLAEKNEAVYKKTWGFAQFDEKNKVKSNNESKFRIGSISKMFTATLIMHYIEQDLLQLTTPLSNFFPEIKNAEKITIKQLLNHHSGIHNFTDDSTYVAYFNKAQSKEQMLGLFKQLPSDFEPGTKASYSNTNYTLLTYIIEKITRSSFEQELKKHITDKIGLKNTYVGSAINPKYNEVYSYEFDGKNWLKSDETDMSIPKGAGNIISTSSDLTHFIYQLFHYKLISKTSLDQMTELEDGYGLGLFQFPFYNKKAYGHTGGIDGFHSVLGYFPDDETSFALMSNALNYRLNDITLGALSIFYNKKYTLPTFQNIKLDASKLEEYVGTYQSKQIPLKITISQNSGQLMAQASGQSAFPLEAETELKFKFETAGIVIEFDKNTDGKINSFTLFQSGGKYLFEK